MIEYIYVYVHFLSGEKKKKSCAWSFANGTNKFSPFNSKKSSERYNTTDGRKKLQSNMWLNQQKILASNLVIFGLYSLSKNTTYAHGIAEEKQ